MSIKRIQGTIYGQFIGDAFGTRYEFSTHDQANEKLINDINNQHFIDILGGGPFHLIPGQVTDDTEMACALIHSLCSQNEYNQDHVAQNYLTWCKSSPFDMGKTTRTALYGNHTTENILDSVSKFNQQSLSNGCLMRISPLAVFYASHSNLTKSLKTACYEDTSLTHCHPVAKDAVYTYVSSIVCALKGGTREEIYKTATEIAETNTVKQILSDAKSHPQPVQLHESTNTVKTPECMGYLGHALQNTFYEILYAKSFEHAMINIVSRGGDTDTNGCIAGALIGAFFGIEGIPEAWKNAVEMENPRTEKYPFVDQTKIPELIEKLVLKIESK